MCVVRSDYTVQRISCVSVVVVVVKNAVSLVHTTKQRLVLVALDVRRSIECCSLTDNFLDL